MSLDFICENPTYNYFSTSSPDNARVRDDGLVITERCYQDFPQKNRVRLMEGPVTDYRDCKNVVHGITKQYRVKLFMEEKRKVKKIPKKYPKIWTKMTPELFTKIVAWERSHEGIIKQADVEKKWNVNRTTYYRWKLRGSTHTYKIHHAEHFY